MSGNKPAFIAKTRTSSYIDDNGKERFRYLDIGAVWKNSGMNRGIGYTLTLDVIPLPTSGADGKSRLLIELYEPEN